uniref:CCHC-type domain-containing protein n=1 Tax=Gasterosteus aculeatus aculeatus TaxID=481459 RepID=A0AAQ4QDU8_GASAC
MNPADSDNLKAAIGAQGNRLKQQEDQLSALQHGVEGLASGQEDFKAAMTTQVNLLSNQIHQMLTHLNQAPSASPVLAAADAPPAPAPHSQAIRLAPPEKFSGESRECKSFIVNCEMHYEQLPSAFPTERSKVAFMISHLTGRAKVWATTEWSRASPSCQSLARFTETLRRVFDPTTSGRETARELNTIRQGMASVSDYAIRFRTLAADSGWNATALYDAFISGLSDPIQDLLVPLDLPEDLDAVIALAVRTDHRLKTRMQDRGLPSTNSRVVSPLPSPVQWRAVSSRDPEEPMQLGQARLSAEERRRRLQEGRCFYCGEQGHLVVGCPARRTTHQGKKSPLLNRFASSGSSSRSLMKIQIPEGAPYFSRGEAETS